MSAKEEDAVPQKFNFTSEKSKWVLDEAGKRRRLDALSTISTFEFGLQVRR